VGTFPNRPIGAACYSGPFYLCSNAVTGRSYARVGDAVQFEKLKKDHTAARRMKRYRIRKRLRDLLSSHDSFIALDLQQHYQSRQLPSDCWVSAEEFFSGYAPDHRAMLLQHHFTGTESAIAQINGTLVKLIRPKFLPKG
jgi:hypothetical protein